MPKVSVITPVYCDVSQKVDWLDEMIRSVQAQTVTDWELILINDGSPVPLDNLIATHRDDSRLRWLDLDANYGPAMARNMAAELAESDCLLPLDADDLLASDESLEIMYDTWIMDKSKTVYGNLQMYSRNKANQFERSDIKTLNTYTFEVAMSLLGTLPVTIMHSKECHYQAGGWKPELTDGLEDVEYWIAAGKRGFCGHKINFITFLYRRREETSRSYKMSFANKSFRAMQEKIKDMHSDVFNGRFPMGCCDGKGAQVAPALDPTVMSQHASRAARVSELNGYDEKDLEWVTYQGRKQGGFSVLVNGPAGLPSSYNILGTGHCFQIHKQHHRFFSDRQRLGFQINQPDPRQREEIKPEPVVTPEPRIVEVPRPALPTLVRLDAVAAGTKEVIVTPPTVSNNVPLSLEDLGLPKGLTNTLDNADYTIESLASSLPDSLLPLPGIGKKRANSIIAKAKELITKT